MLNNYFKKQSGLTLIELLVVLAIIGILSAVGVPSYNKFVQKGEFAEAYNGINNLYRFARSEAIKTSSTINIQRYNDQFIVVRPGAVYADKLAATSFVDRNVIFIAATQAIAISGNGSLPAKIGVSVTDRRNGNVKYLCILQNGQSYKSDTSCPQ